MSEVRSNAVSSRALVILVVVFGLLLTATAAVILMKVVNSPKIAVVDNSFLVNQFSEAIAARKAFEVQKLEWEKNIRAIQDTLDSAAKDMSVNYSKAPAAVKTAMEGRLNHWNQEYRRYLKTVDEMSVRKEQELMAPVLEQLNSFVKTWGKQHGFDIILGSGNGGVILSAAEQYNVTDILLKDLNKMYQGRTSASKTKNENQADSVRQSLPVPAKK